MQTLNSILSDIGMKSYQWNLFFVCGSGWIADNMWLQGISAVLPKVQQEFGLSNELSGLMITMSMLGMTVGSSIWGRLSDKIGRKPSFTYTLLIAFLFGSACAFSNSFTLLCISLFGMGTGVGGNLPVDGALFLEFMPPERQGLLTLLSIFWPVGSVISSCLAWGFIPNYESGWRLVFFSLGMITLIMFVMRTIFFKLYESPKFLISCGRFEEAFKVLQILAKQNNVEIEIDFQEFKDSFQIESKSNESITSNHIESDSMSPNENQVLLDQEGSSENSSFWKRIMDPLRSEPWSELFSYEYRQTTILIW